MASRQNLQRIDQLTGPPVVGRYYLVPTVRHVWGRFAERPWPVMGSKHIDVEFFDFNIPHYHIDRRFLPSNHPSLSRRGSILTASIAETMPLYGHDLPPVVWRRRKCRRALMSFPTSPPQIVALQASFVGQACKAGPAGLICPHRGFPLGSIVAGPDGVITCPMHGLRINAETGLVIATAGQGEIEEARS